jgi:hypothetical protein
VVPAGPKQNAIISPSNSGEKSEEDESNIPAHQGAAYPLEERVHILMLLTLLPICILVAFSSRINRLEKRWGLGFGPRRRSDNVADHGY